MENSAEKKVEKYDLDTLSIAHRVEKYGDDSEIFRYLKLWSSVHISRLRDPNPWVL